MTQSLEITKFSSYRHEQLKPGQFRLLTLQPSADLEALLICSLQVYNLEGHRPHWDAISYHYGDDSLTHQVHIDDTILLINANAHTALKHCRYHDRPRTLWMDQICISQADEDEKFEQLPMMGRIFRDAKLVLIYLCDAWPGLEQFFRFLNIINHKPRPWTLEYWLPQTTAPENFPLRKMLDPDRKFPRYTWDRMDAVFTGTNTDFGALVHHQNNILSKPWFSRLWIVQEASLAKKLHIQCSNLVTTWDALITSLGRIYYWPVTLLTDAAPGYLSASAIEMLRGQQPGQKPSLRSVWYDFRYDLKHTKPSGYWTLLMRSIRQLLTPQYPDFIAVLQDFRTQKSTDKRDKVFGLLGLADPATALATVHQPSEDATSVQRTISGVSYTFAVYQILQSGTLDVLTATCMNASAHEDLPFWVPDWSQTAPPCDTRPAFSLHGIPHAAGTQHRADPEFISSEKAIVLRGVCVDTVSEVLHDILSPDHLHDPSAPIWTTWKTFALNPVPDDIADPYDGPTGRHDAFWRTLMYNTDGASRPATPIHGREFSRWLDGEFLPYTDRAQFVTGRIVLKSRRLFRTRRGYLGNACCEVTPGDAVYVLCGGRLPFVLRADRDVHGVTMPVQENGFEPQMKRLRGFKLVGGSAYVHGFENGQVWEFARREGIEVEEIALV